MSSIKNIAWVPCNLDLSGNRLFELDLVRDNAIERFVEAKKLLSRHGFISNTIDTCNLKKVDVIIFYSIALEMRWLIKAIKSNPQVRLINIPIEPPVISPLHHEKILSNMPFDCIMVWNDDLVKKGPPFVRANIGEPVIYDAAIALVPYNMKKFLVAIYSNKFVKHEKGLYGERLQAFDFFYDKPEGLDLYGMGWGKSTRSCIVSSYRGKCETKKEVLKKYKYSICFENAEGYPGLITEKIFDCFSAGTVPIYYGAPNVQEYIPKDCFIDFRDFEDYRSLYNYLVEMTESDYQAYLDAVKMFVNTSEYYEFTSKRFAEIVLEEIQSFSSEKKTARRVHCFKKSLVKIVLDHPIIFLKNIKGFRRFLFDLVTVW